MESDRVEDTWDWFSVSVVSSRVGWILPRTLLPLPWGRLHSSLCVSHGSSHSTGAELPPSSSKYLAPICDSSREGAAISAVCSFRPQDIRAVLNGPFRELKHDCNRGLPVMDNDVPQPRPGEVRGLKN